MGLFDGFRSMGPRLQQQGYNSPLTYLRDIAQQQGQSSGQFTGYPTNFGAAPPPNPGYAPRTVTGTVTPPYPVSPQQLAEMRQYPSYAPPGGGALPSEWLRNPLSPDKYNLAPGQSGAAYNIGGGRTLYTGGAQSPTSLAQGNRRRMKSQLDQMRGRMNVQYDPSQFSDNLNYFLNNRVLGYKNWTPERRNDFLDRVVGHRELERARYDASPEYAALSRQYASLPRGIIG